MNNYPGTVHECPEIISRRSIYLNLDRLPQVGADVPLAINVPDDDLLRATHDRVSQPGVEFTILDVAGVDLEDWLNSHLLSISSHIRSPDIPIPNSVSVGQTPPRLKRFPGGPFMLLPPDRDPLAGQVLLRFADRV